MKKFILLLVLTSFVSCGSLKTANPNADRWIERTVLPSQVSTRVAIIFKEDLKTGIYESYSVGGYIDDPDSTYYYNSLYQDFNWYKNAEGGWSAPGGSKRPKEGYLYINLKKRVAVYFYPKEGFNTFRVTLNPKSND